MPQVGDYIPWYNVQPTVGPVLGIHTLAGRYIVQCFFESASNPFGRRVLDDIQRHAERFDGTRVMFYGVSVDPRDEHLRTEREKGIFVIDRTRDLSRVLGIVSDDGQSYQPQTIILDPMLRVAAVLPFDGDPQSYVPRLLNILDALPTSEAMTGSAPIIVLSHVFEPDFCRMLIGLYEQHGGHDLGMMMDVNGKTIRTTDHRFKSRLDYEIADPEIMDAAIERLRRRVVPEIRRAFQFNPTRVERHIVACYDAATDGHFNAHRDNMTAATAHRKFAVTINLNTEEFKGGDLCFPEYGARRYRCPTGGAVVFSCTLLHEAQPVTKGRRFAYLPFLCDEEGYQQYVAGHPAAGHFP
jgi:peroxiredoxin